MTAWHTFASIMHMCGYPGHCWSSTCHAITESTALYSHVIPWHDICCVHLHQLVMNFLQCDTLHMQNKVTLHTSALMMFPVGLPSVKSVYGDTTVLMVPYHGCRQSTCAHYTVKYAVRWCCLTWDMLFSYFQKHPCVCILWWGTWLEQCGIYMNEFSS